MATSPSATSRILSLLKTWVGTGREEFQKNQKFVDLLKSFVVKECKMLKSKEEEAIVSGLLNDIFCPFIPKIRSLLPTGKPMKDAKIRPSDILNYAPETLAQIFTVIDYDMFQLISPRECLNKHFVDATKGPNFYRMTERFNKFGLWVQTMIVESSSMKQRAAVISQFLQVAAYCLQYNNFNSAMVIYTALNSVAVSRLKQTWEKVPKRCIKILEDIDELFSMRFNYKNYRDALAKATPPVVPYIGLYTKFLFAIEETNPSKLQNGLINFEKLRMIYNVMKELQKFQGKPYDFNIDSDVLWQFIDIKPLTESELYQLSTKHNETQRK